MGIPPLFIFDGAATEKNEEDETKGRKHYV